MHCALVKRVVLVKYQGACTKWVASVKPDVHVKHVARLKLKMSGFQIVGFQIVGFQIVRFMSPLY